MNRASGTTEISPETPLRLAEAAARAFPDGSMTVSGLRREAGRGRLVIERVAGKDYTTLAAIDHMRQLCRLAAKAPTSGSEKNEQTEVEPSALPFGSSATANIGKALDALDMTLQALKGHSGDTSPTSMRKPRRKAARVIPLKYRSLMS